MSLIGVKKVTFTLLLLATNGFVSQVSANESQAISEPLEEYFDFASYADGVVSPAQLQSLGDIQYIDTRKEEDFSASHIDGAINIDWRQVVFNLDKVSKDKLVVLYCDTGILSSKSHLALRLLGYENVRVLFGGYTAYKQHMSAK